MTLSFSKTPTFIALSCLALLTLTACKGDVSSDLQTQGEAYIRANLTTLSPRSPVAGTTFQITDIEWVDEDTALVTYSAGSIRLRGRTDVKSNGNRVTATRFRLETDLDSDDEDEDKDEDKDDDENEGDDHSSKSSSMSSRMSSVKTSGSSLSSVMTSSSITTSAGVSAGASLSN